MEAADDKGFYTTLIKHLYIKGNEVMDHTPVWVTAHFDASEASARAIRVDSNVIVA